MKPARVKFRPQLLLRFPAQLANLALPELVGQGLPRPHDVAVDLNGDVLIGLSGVVLEELNRMVPRPAHRMHPRIHHEAHRPPHFVAELPEFRVGIFVHSQVFAEALGIQPPAFHERRITDMLAEFRLPLHLLRERNLQVMPGHGFVQRERFHLPLRPRAQIVGVHEIASRPARARRPRLIIGGRLRRRLEIRNRTHTVGQTRELAEKARKLRINLLGNDAVAVHQIFRLVVEKSRIGSEELREVLKTALESRGSDDLVHLRADAPHLGESDFVNLLRRQVCRGLPAHMKGVRGRAIRQRRGGDRFAARRQIGRNHVFPQLLKRGRDRARVDLLCPRGHARALRLGKARRKFGERLEQSALHRIRRNQIRNLFGEVAQHQFRRRVAFFQARLEESEILFDASREGIEPRENIFVIRNRLARHGRNRHRRILLDSAHLIYGHPEIERHDFAERQRIVAVLQSLLRGFQQSPVEVVIEPLLCGKGIARNIFQRRQAFVEMLLARFEAFRGVVIPPAVLPGIAYGRCRSRVLLHPALPVFIEIRAEFSRCLRLAAGLVCACLRQGQHRHQQPSCDGSHPQHRQQTHHPALPALANSLSRSRASITISRAVSSMPIAVLSTSTASAARASGETLRSRSRRSRSITSSKTSASVIFSPFSSCSLQRRSARTSGEASRKILSSALGKTTVPMSRPSMTTPPPAPARRCSATSTRRTPAMVAKRDAARATSAVRISCVTSWPSRNTEFFAPAASCSGVGGRSSMWLPLASASRRSWSAKETFVWMALRPTARYIAPLSRYRYSSSAATRRATLLFPEPAGPSMAIVSLLIELWAMVRSKTAGARCI